MPHGTICHNSPGGRVVSGIGCWLCEKKSLSGSGELVCDRALTKFDSAPGANSTALRKKLTAEKIWEFFLCCDLFAGETGRIYLAGRSKNLYANIKLRCK